MKNSYKSRLVVLFSIALLLLVGCKERAEKSADQNESSTSPTEQNFIKVDVNVPLLKFVSTVTFNPNEYAMISWSNSKADSSFQIYLHCTKGNNGEKMVNALLFKVESDQSLKLLSDNLTQLHPNNKLSDNKGGLKISTTNISDAKVIAIKYDACCTSSCSNGRPLTCCNGCCSDPYNGCAGCCP